MEIHDLQLYRHSLHVGMIAATFTTFLEYSHRDRSSAILAALLHDVGKLQLPISILRKSNPLTEAEWDLMRCHPDIGVVLLRREADCSIDVLTAVQQHHERLDGSGYALGLRAPYISELVRVLAICDAYAAMTEDRIYEESYGAQQALQVLQERRRQFDPLLVRQFSRMVLREPTGKVLRSIHDLNSALNFTTSAQSLIP